ncbi:SNF2-related protein [Enterobacter huaxiensis]|uniref:DEAD/DEAH box helicase n=1 Tax=Enterobacter huaxiensis TaxID=2494702 RepID=UPI0021757E7E|nr:DEAD/DEAH box helicase [Enterobacter huaxiensis]MCS5452532.1 DEAD/DEAH box helicase [Enterobacter huaxiensis]
MVSKKFNPREYQKIIIDAVLTIKRINIYASMGTGKTVSCLTAIAGLKMAGALLRPVLVLAPLRVAVSTWPDECQKWDHLKDLKVVHLTGSAAARNAASKLEADIFTCNYENIPWLVTVFPDWPFQMIIADESTRLKGFRLRGGSKRAAALAKKAHITERFVNLTGTPAPNGLIDLWGQNYFIDRGERLGRTFSAFIGRWFRQERLHNFVKITPWPHSQKEIHQAISGVTLSIDGRDWFDVAEPVHIPVLVKLDGKARKLYDQMEKELFLELATFEVEALSAAAKTVKCLQIASGALYTDDRGSWEEIHNAKLLALESIIEEANGMPVLVAYQWKHDLTRLKAFFPQGKEFDSDPKTLKAWNAGKIPVLFIHPASGGHGISMQDGGNILAFFSHWYNLEEYQQIIERIGPVRQMQSGYDRPVYVYHLLAADTVDSIVMARRETKREVQDLLLEAVKHRQAANDEEYRIKANG